jgi:hypothetical protein
MWEGLVLAENLAADWRELRLAVVCLEKPCPIGGW